MDNDGSTSAELEDPRTDAEPESVDQERDTTAAVDTEPDPQPESTGDEPVETSAPEPVPKDRAGKSAKVQGKATERPDPVKAAIEKLRSDAPTPDAKAKPSANTAEKPTQPTRDDAAQPDQREQPADPALAWMTPEQRRHTKGSVKEFIRKQHMELATARQTLETSKGDADIGSSWAKLIETQGLGWEAENLSNEAIAGALKSQGAMARAYSYVQQGYAPRAEDLAVLEQQRTSLSAIDRLLGRSSTGEPSLHEGEIPQDLAGLADLGLSEREQRLIAADRSRQTGKTKPTAPTLAAAPVAPPRSAAAAPAPQGRQSSQAAPDATAQHYVRMTAQAIAQRFQVPADQVGAFYQRNLAPVVTKMLADLYPDKAAQDAFKAIGTQAQHDLVKEAMTRFETSQRSTPPAPRRPSNTPLRTGGAPTQSAPGDSVLAAIQRLRSD